MNEYSPENITELKPNEVFVFGSNYAGRHGKGAALIARKNFGAIQGQGSGLMGRSYAIPTKDHHLRTLPVKTIGTHVEVFLKYATQHPEKRFVVTMIGCGLAGYKPEDMAPLFNGAPANVILPLRFVYP